MESNDELYNENDVKLLNEKINDIIDKVRAVTDEIMEPTRKELNDVTKIISEYLKSKKRKIYGGYALHLLVKNANKDDGIYKESDTPDIDFYSPEPLQDLYELCDIINDKGYKQVTGKEAQHAGTYNLYVNMHLYCDITYVPKIVYNHMPFIKINDMIVIHPYFMAIDYLRMLTDPLLSFPFRFKDKPSFKRFYLLQHYYPFYRTEKKIPIDGQKTVNEISNLHNTIYGFMQDNKGIINIGHYAYIHYLERSGITAKGKFDIDNVPFFEIISANYKNDAKKLIDLLKKSSIDPKKINYVEYFPFFQFLDYSVRIYYGDTLLVKIYDNNKKCLPFFEVPYYEIKDRKVNVSNSHTVTIGTFSLTILYFLINVMKYRCDENIHMQNMYYTMISNMTEFRNNYMKKNNKNIFDDTIFQEFAVNCIGKAIPPERERQKLIEYRKKKGKKLSTSYKPEDGKQSPPKYVFANTSGNPINNDKKRILNKSDEEIDDIVEAEDDGTDELENSDEKK